MDGAANAAAAAAPEVDLENGGAAAVTVEERAYPADKRLKEKQPFTWLGAAPYIAVLLAGAALIVAGAVIYDSGGPATTEGQGQGQRQGSQQPYHMATVHQVGRALMSTGTVLVLLGMFVSAFAADEGCCECNPRRFGPD